MEGDKDGGEFGDGTAGSPGPSDSSSPADSSHEGFGGVNSAPGYSDAPDNMAGFDTPQSDVVSFSTKPLKEVLGFVAGLLPGGNLFNKAVTSNLPDTATYSRSAVEAGRDLGRGESGEAQQFFGGVTGGVGHFAQSQVLFKRPPVNTQILSKAPQNITNESFEKDDQRIISDLKQQNISIPKKQNYDTLILIAAVLTLVSTIYG